MIQHHNKRITASVLLLVFFVAAEIPARGQVTTGRGRQGRRVGSVVLPTPPFNPDAGILNGPRTRRATSSKVTQRRPVNRSVRDGNRKPRPGTPRKRRVRRGQQRS